MVPNDESQCLGIVKLLLHFQWTWIGLLAVSSDKGERFLKTLMPLLTRSGICVAVSRSLPIPSDVVSYAEMFSDMISQFDMLAPLLKGSFNVLVYYGDFRSISTISKLIGITQGKVWITTTLMEKDFSLCGNSMNAWHFYGSLSFVIQANQKPSYDRNAKKKFDQRTRNIPKTAFNCLASSLDMQLKKLKKCTEKEMLKTLPQDLVDNTLKMAPDSYTLYNTIKAVAYALNAAFSSRAHCEGRMAGDRLGREQLQPWQVFLWVPNQLHQATYHQLTVGA